MIEASKCRITHVDTSKTALKPIIVEFQNGSLRPEAAKNLQCGVYEHKLTKRRCIAVVDGATSYKGHEDEDNCCQTLIAIRNRKTNDVRLITASKVLMAPVIQRELVNNTKTSTVREDLLELSKSFGTKKDRQRAEQQTKLRLNVDAVKDELEAVASQVVVRTEDLNAPQDTFLASLPPCNRNAKRDFNVYNLADMVSEEDIAELEKEAKHVLKVGEEETFSSFEYSKLYKLLLPHILAQQDEEAKLRNLAVLTYMEYIIELIQTPATQFQRSTFVMCRLSTAINQKLLDTFTVPGPKGRVRTMEMKDKATCYVVLLSLLLLDFSVPFESIVSSVGCNSSELTQLCRALGVSVVSIREHKHAVLSLPLPPPPQNVKFLKRRDKKK